MRVVSVALLLIACEAEAPLSSADTAAVAPEGEAPAGMPVDQAPPPGQVVITLDASPWALLGEPITLTATGPLGEGERVYFYATKLSGVTGPCLSAAGGLCLDIKKPGAAIGSALADDTGTATFDWVAPAAWTVGTNLKFQAVIVRAMGGDDSLKTNVVARTIAVGPPEGTVLADWLKLDVATDGYREGCTGETWVKSTPYASPKYVAATRCTSEHEYKIQLGDALYGRFYSAADWSGSGEDQCEWIGGEFVSFPQGSTAIDPNTGCWSRGAAGVTPTFEPACLTNRWVAPVTRCSAKVPLAPNTPAEGSLLTTWTAFDVYDDGYREGCAGGVEYVKSTSFRTGARYVSVRLCDADTYKIRLSSTLWGIFRSAGDWSGQGEDHCDYVGGTSVSLGPSTAADANQVCWSRGNSPTAPVLESPCQTNRWIPTQQTCSVSIP